MNDIPFSRFYFRLSILGLTSESDAAFQEISGLTAKTDTEEVTCVGENRFKYLLPKVPTYQNLVLKRGVTDADSPLRTWCSNTFKNGLNKGIETRDLEIVLLDEAAKPCFQWIIHGAYLVGWSTSNMHSEKNQLLIESMEFSFNYFEAEVLDNTGIGLASLFR